MTAARTVVAVVTAALGLGAGVGPRIEFVVPDDWLCAPYAGCLVCRNVADHETDVRVYGAGRRGGHETHRVLPADALRVCPPEDPST